MASPNDRKYTKSHEWVKVEGGTATVGLTEFAISAIKDIVFLELPESGRALEAQKPFGVIESVKAVFDLNAPLSGTVTEVHQALVDDFDTLAKDPYGKGWLLKFSVAPGSDAHLLDAAAYDKHCAEEHH